MQKVNWTKIFEEAGGTHKIDMFCSGLVTRREVESLGSHCRNAVRSLGADGFKSRARHALYRFNQRQQVG